jgi:hypothetical protein
MDTGMEIGTAVSAHILQMLSLLTITGFLDFVHRLEFKILGNTVFPKLIYFRPQMRGLLWVP